MKLRKITALLAASVMTVCAATAATASAADCIFVKRIRGDVNFDKRIDSKDLDAVKIHIRRNCLKGDSFCAADVNWDGKVDSKDVKALEAHIKGKKKIHTGDANTTNYIEFFDVTAVMDYIIGQKPLNNTQRYAADVNGDNLVDIEDYLMIRDYYFS